MKDYYMIVTMKWFKPLFIGFKTEMEAIEKSKIGTVVIKHSDYINVKTKKSA